MPTFFKIFIALILIISSCDKKNKPSAKACTEEARAGINVTVRTAEHNALLYDSVVVVIAEGSYTETLTGFDPVNKIFSGAFEREGTYNVTATHPSYQARSQSGIVVSKDECHVIPAQITMTLTHK